jgi:AcrR family transcriptional regulator
MADALQHLPAAKRRPTEAAGDTRARIVEVAERLFRSMGYQKTAVADIARELGMSPANVYRFFPSKSAINEAIAERLLAAIRADVAALAADRAVPAPERLRRLLRMVFDRHLGLFFAERRMHDMVAAAMTEHWGVIERFVGEVRAAMAAVIADGQRAGDFAAGLDPEAEAGLVQKAMMAWMHPTMLENCLAHGVDEAEAGAGVDRLARFCLRALRAGHDE